MGRAPEGPALLLLLVLLLAAAFGSTLPTANIGAVLLNVNTAEARQPQTTFSTIAQLVPPASPIWGVFALRGVGLSVQPVVRSTGSALEIMERLIPLALIQVRGTICAIYTVLDDISKAVGTVVASLLGALVGSRALAFQLSMRQVLYNALAVVGEKGHNRALCCFAWLLVLRLPKWPRKHGRFTVLVWLELSMDVFLYLFWRGLSTKIEEKDHCGCGVYFSLWLLSAGALLAASATYAADEARVIAAESRGGGSGFRQLSDEGAQDRMPLLLKHQQQVLQQEASTLAQCVVNEIHEDYTDVRLRLLKQPEQAQKLGASETAADIWGQLEEHGTYSQHRSRL